MIGSNGWLDAIRGGPAPVTSSDRMRALGEVATALAPLPADDRADQIENVVALYKATRDEASRKIVGVVGALPRPKRDSLAGSEALSPLLDAIADLPAATQQALADGRLQLLPDDPARLHLIRSIAELEPPAVRLINSLEGVTDPNLRQAIIYVVNQIRSGSPQAFRLITLYWSRDPGLMAFIETASSTPTARARHAR